ncbi:hypothetical protein [Elstera litoralis]|uniref:hypothetical protein n=1 Tax=Elstera litoralis TaxID=552518 RepID=UPI0012ECC0E9|nr:hypothetical protein [Elstera litoralis]
MTDDEFKYWFEIHYYICAALLKATYPNWEKSRDWLASNFTEIIGAGSSASYASNGKVSKLSYLKNIRMITLSISAD